MSCTKTLYTNHPTQSPNCRPISTRSLPTPNLCGNTGLSAFLQRFGSGDEWAMSGCLSGDGQAIYQGNWYRESLYVMYCLHI